MTRRRLAPRRAFLLLAVAVALALGSVLVARVARHSLRLATDARDRRAALQERWGAASCQRTLLALARELFEARDRAWQESAAEGEPPPPRYATSIVLGGQRFDLLLADEDAKPNLNAIYAHDGPAAVERTVRIVARANPALPVRLAPEVGPPPRRATSPRRTPTTLPRPADPEAEPAEEPPPPATAFRTWGQVFDLARARPPEGARLALPTVTGGVSLSGTGRLNLRRARDADLEEVVRLVLSASDAGRFVRQVRERPQLDLPTHLELLDLEPEDQDALLALLAEQSACYSLWIQTERRGVRRLRWVVMERDVEGTWRVAEYQF